MSQTKQGAKGSYSRRGSTTVLVNRQRKQARNNLVADGVSVTGSALNVGNTIARAAPDSNFAKTMNITSSLHGLVSAANQGSAYGVGMSIANLAPDSAFAKGMSMVNTTSSTGVVKNAKLGRWQSFTNGKNTSTTKTQTISVPQRKGKR